jgi:outer membrane beta-barrel protein
VQAQQAAQVQRPRLGAEGVEVELYGGVFIPNEPAFLPTEPPFNLDPRDPIFGARLGYTFPINFFLQGEVGYSPLAFVQASGARNVNMLVYGGSLGYNLQVARPLQFFLLGGAGAIHWDADNLSQENKLRLHVGGGFRAFLSRAVAIRVEFRDHIVPATMTQIREDLIPPPGLTAPDEATHNFEISGGISLFFDTRRDNDGDGIDNDSDRCPNTARGVLADSRGCPLDGDADGVADSLDRCPATMGGVPIDASGCPLDADGDGVIDGSDLCPNTPMGSPVNERGCEKDSDSDGVPDGSDLCPNTAEGVTVNATGCSLDVDGDNVPDARDRCPSTPPGRAVNDEGCSRIESGLEAGRLILSEISFRTGSSALAAESRRVLDEVAEALTARPNMEIEIQGHSDSQGSAAANLRLSDRRARAVYDYLIGTYPSLNRSRFVVRGYGETSPIASNDTASGRRANRRVEFLVLNR